MALLIYIPYAIYRANITADATVAKQIAKSRGAAVGHVRSRWEFEASRRWRTLRLGVKDVAHLKIRTEIDIKIPDPWLSANGRIECAKSYVYWSFLFAH